MNYCPVQGESKGTLSNEDGNVNDDGSEKSPFWSALYFFVLVEAKQTVRKFLLLRPRSPDNLK